MVLKQQAPAIKAVQHDFFRACRQETLENEGLSFEVTSTHRGIIANGLLNRSGTGIITFNLCTFITVSDVMAIKSVMSPGRT